MRIGSDPAWNVRMDTGSASDQYKIATLFQKLGRPACAHDLARSTKTYTVPGQGSKQLQHFATFFGALLDTLRRVPQGEVNVIDLLLSHDLTYDITDFLDLQPVSVYRKSYSKLKISPERCSYSIDRFKYDPSPILQIAPVLIVTGVEQG